MRKIAVAITGASGSIYAQGLLEKLCGLKEQVTEIALVMSQNAQTVWQTELGNERWRDFPVRRFERNDFSAPIASGSGQYDTLIIVPTRELAQQIDQQVEGFGYFTGVSSISVYGGGDGATVQTEDRVRREAHRVGDAAERGVLDQPRDAGVEVVEHDHRPAGARSPRRDLRAARSP